MKTEEITKKLVEPFKASEVEWRIQGVDQTRLRGLAVPYVDSRAIQRRLDDAVGCFGWRNEFRQWHENSQLCSISILHAGENENQEWVGKCDGAENSTIEAVKGGLSDSFKRAAVLWGIGRYLYDFGAKWVDIEKKGDSFAIKQSEYPALEVFHDSEVKRLSSGQSNSRSKDALLGSTSTGSTANLSTSSQNPSKANNASNDHLPESSQGNKPVEDKTVLYLVKRRLVSTNTRGQSTQLEMVSLEDGTIVKAFLRGNDETVSEGVKLKNIKLTEKQGTNRNYNVLEAFEIAS